MYSYQQPTNENLRLLKLTQIDKKEGSKNAILKKRLRNSLRQEICINDNVSAAHFFRMPCFRERRRLSCHKDSPRRQA